MRQRILAIIMSLMAHLGFIHWAQAAVIDFNAAPGVQFATAPYDEDGFRLSVLSGHYDIWGAGTCGVGQTCTSKYLGVDGNGLGGGDSRLRITALSGSHLDLFSLLVIGAHAVGSNSPCDATCAVSSSNGGLIPFAAGVMTFSGAEWRNVAWVELFADFDSGPYAEAAIDDIEVAPIPGPAAVWLLGSALGVLGWMRRRATKA
jgi:hypothetical protein